jgi:Cof subfamily protein (haloacid dehalogenase superfamily)
VSTGEIRLVVADVDGALVTPEKILTPRARTAIRRIIESGIIFTITSGRPPRGMKMLIDDLQLQSPVTAFNGGLFCRPDLSVIHENSLSTDAVQPAVGILVQHKLDIWIYSDNAWYVLSRHSPHVDREEWTVKFPPTVVRSFDGLLNRVMKIVGVSDDVESVARCETDVRHELGSQVSAARSQPYYLDVTHPKANKGEVIRVLSRMLQVQPKNIATIGDMPNDVLMFQESGVSIAMGNASPYVQHSARFVTRSNREDGFALAMERFVLGDRAA